MSSSFRTCICPVCGISVNQIHISQHVEQHFITNSAAELPNAAPSPGLQCQAEQNQHLKNEASPCTITGPLQVESSSWEESDVRMCTYAGCQDLIFLSEWDDHMFAHMLEDQDDTDLMSLATGQPLASSSSSLQRQQAQIPEHNLNDSLIAHLTQQELDTSDLMLTDDWLLAQELEQEQKRMKEEEEFKKLQEMYGMSSQNPGFVKQYDRRLKQDVNRMKMSVGDYYARKADMLETLMSGHDSGESQTQGVITCLRASYANGVSGIRAVYLCLETDHFASSVGDAGWGCGYRNTQMLLSSLLRSNLYRKTVLEGIGGNDLPSIPRIQMMIESAWQKGFDQQGAEQLGGKLHNTSKWIGATEITALLRSIRVRARLVDFHQATGSDGTHPSMFTWIHQYYKSGSEADGPAPPLFLQHQGHSRLCIGVEEHPRGECPIYLMLFDPSHAPRQMQALLRNMTTNVSAQLRLLRRSLKQMRSKQYQIVFIDGLIESDTEYQELRNLKSIRLP